MKPTYDEIKRLFGDLDDHTIAEIEDSGATAAELQDVAAHLARETDVMGDLRRPLAGRALAIFTLLQSLEARWDEPR